MMRRLTLLALLTLLVSPLPGPGPAEEAYACVGRKLVLGSLEGERGALVGRILSILIHERTGTTVELRVYPSQDELFQRAREGKLDLYVDYVDRVSDGGAGAAGERFSRVKSRFNEEYNLVWLRPMGYSGRSPAGDPWGAAAVVVGKGTLKTFPALPRLLEKIGGRVLLDDARLSRLLQQAAAGKPAQVARDFLKEERLI